MADASVSDTLGAAGACPEVRVGNKVWKIGHPTQRAKACLEQLAVQVASAEVRALKDVLPPDAYAEVFREFTDSVSARHYRTWGPGWQRVVWGPQSAHLFLLSLLRENHPDATEGDARALAAADPEAVALAVLQVTPNFVRLLLAERPELTPEQRAKVEGAVAAALAKTPHPDPPAPTPPTPAASSDSGASASPRNPGASGPKRLRR